MNNTIIVCAECGGDVYSGVNSNWWCPSCQRYVRVEEKEG